MSNWSAVILSWSSVDGGAQLSQGRRLADIESHSDIYGWQIIQPCGHDDAPGSACVFIAVTHENHFSPASFMEIVSKFHWEYPDEVCLLWKNGDIDSYRQCTVEQWLFEEGVIE